MKINPVLPAFLLILLCIVTGCAMTLPVQRDEQYPREWPDISPLRTECKELSGTYSSVGSITTGNGGVRSISFSEILPEGPSSAGGQSVSLRIETVGFDRFNKNVTGSTLFINGVALSAFCGCMETAICCPNIKHSSGSLGPVMFAGSQRNIWLTKALDGSLLIQITDIGFGLVVVVPYHNRKYSWARFERIAD
jgi:hypothetical protein